MKAQTEKYFEAVGRRKTSIARVRLFVSDGTKNGITINDKDIKEYLNTADSRHKLTEILRNPEVKEKFNITIKVVGGGMSSQVDAIILGIARALTEFSQELRKPLKKEGFLSRDARIKERRKFGLKKARKSPQWSKR
ncbi:MAG: 30S ribosomal protein S9 [bacterium]